MVWRKPAKKQTLPHAQEHRCMLFSGGTKICVRLSILTPNTRFPMHQFSVATHKFCHNTHKQGTQSGKNKHGVCQMRKAREVHGGNHRGYTGAPIHSQGTPAGFPHPDTACTGPESCGGGREQRKHTHTQVYEYTVTRRIACTDTAAGSHTVCVCVCVCVRV